MNKNLERFTALAIGVYVWTMALFFGGILLDIVYSNSLEGHLDASDTKVVLSEVSDFLLCIGGVVILAAVGAIAVSWKSGTSRNLLIASLLMIIVEFITPVFIHQSSQNLQNLDLGPWLRVTMSGLAALLAFIGQHAYYWRP